MKYVGAELELFQRARNWKRYFASHLEPFVRGRVLDVGCGMGANAEYLLNERVTSYTFLEPDPGLLSMVAAHVRSTVLVNAERILGTTEDLPGRRFDTILYIDVIEHIEAPQAELLRAYDLLEPGGHLLILVPAFNVLFSPFDKAVGHHRRYDKSMVRAELPVGLELVRTVYLDSLGFFLSLGNKALLRKDLPSAKQIRTWDRMVVPCSRIADNLVMHTFGRSLVCIAHKPER